jgi:hypothetical protein
MSLSSELNAVFGALTGPFMVLLALCMALIIVTAGYSLRNLLRIASNSPVEAQDRRVRIGAVIGMLVLGLGLLALPLVLIGLFPGTFQILLALIAAYGLMLYARGFLAWFQRRQRGDPAS